MAGIVERRRSAAAPWAPRFASFAAMLFLVAGLGHRYGLVETADFVWTLAVVLGLAAAALVCAGLGMLALWRRGDMGGRRSAAGGLLALLVLVPFAVAGAYALRYPALTDVSTDLADPPALTLAAAARTRVENSIAAFSAASVAQQRAAYPAVTGRRYEAGPDRVLALVLEELTLRGWQLRAQPPTEPATETAIEAIAYTPVFGFPADIAVRLTDEGTTTYVDMRSASRYGRHDLGDNARRIAFFLAALDIAVRNQPFQPAEDQDAR